uniref:Uncharacterized protein n=1 Tax=Arion vulgaris TaxID=1028688 RepID=A0A0B6Y1K9_9EUPU
MSMLKIRLYSHKMKAAQTDQYTRPNDSQISKHFLQTSPIFNDMRSQTWP